MGQIHKSIASAPTHRALAPTLQNQVPKPQRSENGKDVPGD